MDTPLPDYIAAFESKIGDGVSIALGLNNPVLGGLEAMALYNHDLQFSAAVAGHRLEIPQELAIAYLIMAEAMRYEQSSGVLSMALSSKKRELYAKHRKLMEFALSVVKEVPDKMLSQRFMELLVSELKRVSDHRRGA